MAGIYRQRHPERTVFYRVLFHYFEEFLRKYESRFEREYGFLRPVIQDVVEKYLDCGNPMCGFARIRCPDCGEERVGKYMRRHLLSLKRLFFDETAGRVRYQSSRHGSQEESMDYLEFIARVTSHIPDKGQVMIRRTTTAALSCPKGTPDGSRGDGGIFLRASAAVFCLFKGRVYLEPVNLEASGELCCFLCFDLGVLDVIILSQHANRWELRKIVRDLSQAKKRISYKSISRKWGKSTSR